MSTMIYFVLGDSVLTPPARLRNTDAGYDIASSESGEIPPWSTKLIETDMSVVFPEGCYGQLVDRSSLAKRGLHVTGGVIDETYRGKILVSIQNFSCTPWKYVAGDRIAQLLPRTNVSKTWQSECITDSQAENCNFNISDRGALGFGSSGISKWIQNF